MPRSNQARRSRTQSSKSAHSGLLLTAGALVLAIVAGTIWLSSGGREDDGASAPGNSAAVQLPIANLPQVAGGVQVKEPAVERGRLPLDTTVTQVYELVNTGPEAVLLGKPAIEVLDGCCPPQPQLSHSTIGAGQTATVALSMQMHEGMDGPHLFHLTVPVRSAGGEDVLHLYFKGNFQG